MVKPNTDFTKGLEQLLARIWQLNSDELDNTHIRKTREAIIDVRTIYRNKGEKLRGEKVRRYSQSIDFSKKRYRAGYVAAFGERHAYLTYRHLKKVEVNTPDAIPETHNGELTVTVIGAGAALELFGLCYFYNEEKSRIRKLHLNFIEKVDDWQSDRDTMIERIIKKTFPKIQIFTNNINIGLHQDNIVSLSQKYDSLARSDIILIYNVLNEITYKFHKYVWKNLEYIFKICDKRALVLLMEPSANYTLSRIKPIYDRLNVYGRTAIKAEEEQFSFSSGQLKIKYEEDTNGLNIRLFKNYKGGPKPSFEKTLHRIHMACTISPLSPISQFEAEHQFRSDYRQKLASNNIHNVKEQSSFYDFNNDFGKHKGSLKYMNEP